MSSPNPPRRHSRALPLAATVSAALCGVGLLTATPARAASTSVLINEVYGGGGNTGATFTNDFVELYNPTGTTVSLAGWKLNYYSSAGSIVNTCTLSGTAQPHSYFLIQEAKGAAGTTPLPAPDATCTGALSATAGSVEIVDAGGTVVDLVGFGSTATKRETAPAPAPSNTTSVSRTGFADTDNNSVDFTVGSPSPTNSGTPGGGTTPTPTSTPTPTPTPATQRPISEIQGTGPTSPLVGQTVTTTGVVTAAYPTGGFNGFYLQTPGSGGTPRAAGQASDGIFVYGNPTPQIGQCFTVTGTVTEFGGAQPTQKMTELTNPKLIPATGCAPVKATDLATLPVADADKEAYEGMLVKPLGTYTITNNYQLNQYGQVGLAVGDKPLYQATDVVAPGAAAAAYEAENAKKYITLDDGSSWDYMRNPDAQKSPLPYLSQAEPMRTASQVSFVKPVILDYRFQWNYQPTGQIVGATDPDDPVQTENDREATPPAVGGDLQMATFNVLNYFTDLGKDEAGCDSYKDMFGTPVTAKDCKVRGAYTDQAFADQEAKIVNAINGSGAEVVALMEVENSAQFGHDRDATLRLLVDALIKAGGRWAYVPSPQVVPPQEDVIRVGFIYNPDKVQTLGSPQILMDPAFSNARQPLAQKFKARNAGKPFVAIANHFKSKGSGEDDGTGQGLSNPSREAQARALTSWVNQVFPDEAVFLLGDFNSYSKETPVQLIEGAGYTELEKKFEPTSTTYQFDGRLGSLDHIFANAKALGQVSGAGVWDINADESVAMQYSRRHYNIVDFYTTQPYAASDHDPAIAGIQVK